jgi:hypothetical protein
VLGILLPALDGLTLPQRAAAKSTHWRNSH